MPTLQAKLEGLIETFVDDVLEALRAAPLSDLAETFNAPSRATRARPRAQESAPPRSQRRPSNGPALAPEMLVTDPEKLLASVSLDPPRALPEVKRFRTRAPSKPRTPRAVVVAEAPAPPQPLFVIRRRRSEAGGTVHEERVQLPTPGGAATNAVNGAASAETSPADEASTTVA